MEWVEVRRRERWEVYVCIRSVYFVLAFRKMFMGRFCIDPCYSFYPTCPPFSASSGASPFALG